MVVLVLGIPALTAPFLFGIRFKNSSGVPGDSPPPTYSLSATFNWNSSEAPAAEASGDRPVFPYSVIPGGARSAEELRASIEHDPVIASHYANFDVSAARLLRITSARQVYVSYRLHDRILWTRKKVTLPVGEMLLTDGTHVARARCGNRISETPLAPTSPSEPPKEVFNKPVGPASPVNSPDPLLIPPLWVENPPAIPLRLNPSAPATPSGGVPFLPLMPGFPCCGGTIGLGPGREPAAPPLPQPGSPPVLSGGPWPVPYPPASPLPPVATPEPPSLTLLLVSLVGLICVWKFRGS